MLEKRVVDIWHGSLAVSESELESLKKLLSVDEWQRVERFATVQLRSRNVVVRARVRQVLAGYLNKAPEAVQFVVGSYGKPGLVGDPLYFNLSHSGDGLLLAVADIPVLGVDMEFISPRNGVDGLVERFFAAGEWRGWRRLPEIERLEGFYRLWTKKEAFVKAVGRGLALGLETFEVDAVRGGGLLQIPAEYGAVSEWKMFELALGSGVCAALAVKETELRLRYRPLP